MPESNGFLVRPKLYSSGGLIPLRSAALADDKMLAAAEAEGLKEDLLSLASSTQRGFKASREERRRAKNLAEALEKLNPTEEPARSYYEGNSSDDSGGAGSADLSGKWTLVSTDARDITTLDSGGPFAPSKLGRIGQECSPPVIKNVIEWKKPDWATALPFSGGDDARVLQKVCCEGVAKREDPRTVDLKIVGLDIVGDQGETKQSSEIASDIVKRIQGGPAGLVGESPIEVRGFVKPPFGKFEILYLDEQMRIIQTYQGYLAVNVRQTPGEEWF